MPCDGLWFEQLIRNLFSTIQVFRFTLDNDVDPAYMDARRWKHLIIPHMPNLRIFDIQFDISANNRLKFEAQIHQFTLPFWIERQWFFAHHFYQSGKKNYVIFYSTNPYRY